MDRPQDFYELLGVSVTATPEEIRAGFRKAASTAHPDKGGSPEKMPAINEAYAVLGDAARRAEYDKSGATNEKPAGRVVDPGTNAPVVTPDGSILFRTYTEYDSFRGETFHTCSDDCQWIFEREPEKYVQAWLPVHQIYQGNCGGPAVPDVLAWYGIQDGDNGEYRGSPDQLSWAAWHETVPARGA